MTYDEYWNGEPERAKMYRKASYLKIESNSYESWLQGAYTYDAFSKVMSNVFAKRGAKQNKYMETPIKVLPKTDEERLIEAEKQRRKLEAQLTAWANSFGKR